MDRRQPLLAIDTRLCLRPILKRIGRENDRGDVEIAEYGVYNADLLRLGPHNVWKIGHTLRYTARK